MAPAPNVLASLCASFFPHALRWQNCPSLDLEIAAQVWSQKHLSRQSPFGAQGSHESPSPWLTGKLQAAEAAEAELAKLIEEAQTQRTTCSVPATSGTKAKEETPVAPPRRRRVPTKPLHRSVSRLPESRRCLSSHEGGVLMAGGLGQTRPHGRPCGEPHRDALP